MKGKASKSNNPFYLHPYLNGSAYICQEFYNKVLNKNHSKIIQLLKRINTVFCNNFLFFWEFLTFHAY